MDLECNPNFSRRCASWSGQQVSQPPDHADPDVQASGAPLAQRGAGDAGLGGLRPGPDQPRGHHGPHGRAGGVHQGSHREETRERQKKAQERR